jgi:hypothetical protein
MPEDTTEKLDHARLLSFVERLHRAGWITGMSAVTDRNFAIAYTERGLLAMAELCDLFLAAKAANGEPRQLVDAVEFVNSPLIKELWPEGMSENELHYFVGLLGSFMQRPGTRHDP